MATMIRINLLPIRQGKKREISKQFLVLFLVMLVGVVLGNYMFYDKVNTEFDQNAKKLALTQARIAELEKVIGEVNNLNQRKKEVEDKLKILTNLRKSRTGPVKLLDALATAMPKKVWITDFDEKANEVKVTGTAASHDDVADLMRSLANVVWTSKGMGRLVEQKRDAKTSRVELLSAAGVIEDFAVADVSTFFSNIELKRAEQKDTRKESSGKLVDFEISMAVNYAI